MDWISGSSCPRLLTKPLEYTPNFNHEKGMIRAVRAASVTFKTSFRVFKPELFTLITIERKLINTGSLPYNTRTTRTPSHCRSQKPSTLYKHQKTKRVKTTQRNAFPTPQASLVHGLPLSLLIRQLQLLQAWQPRLLACSIHC